MRTTPVTSSGFKATPFAPAQVPAPVPGYFGGTYGTTASVPSTTEAENSLQLFLDQKRLRDAMGAAPVPGYF